MNNSALLNPYALLGVNINSTFNELKRNYYNMALMCHPDKGGSGDDMYIVLMAYNYCKKQLEKKEEKETTYEKLEEEFADFCKNQEAQLPPFNSVYEETNDWIKDFNREFEGLTMNNGSGSGSSNGGSNNVGDVVMHDPFKDGYGDLMDIGDEENSDEKPVDLIDYNDIEEQVSSNQFKNQIVKYEEPAVLPDTITHFPLNCDKIDDFSGVSNNLQMNDYYKSFGGVEEMKEEDFVFRDFPSIK